MSKPGMVGRGLFAAAVACALSVGVTQAFARPESTATRLSCSPNTCDRDCVLSGYRYGVCNNGECECWHW